MSVRAGTAAPATATTSGDGIARVGDLAPGEYVVQTSAGGYSDATTKVSVAAGELAAIDVTLKRIATAPPIDNQVPRPPGISTPDADAIEVPTLPPAAPRGRSTDVEQPTLAPDEHVFVPMPDRWNISMPDWDRYGEKGDYPYVSGRWWDPFNRNRLKGDYPIIGQQTFFVLTGISDSLLEGRSAPIPAVPSSQRPLSERFFGRGGLYLPVSVVRTSFDLFRGDTAFRPVDWRVRVQPAISFNYLHTQERGIVNADVRKGNTRFDTHVGLQEAFFEAK
ncbi:MAG TPA: carboxypeptidase-like regulatory domain-containing protein, partial [Vicinamibacterales bacterium]|nr:carboxypeptidase-like regulatory domain-containing protein [Vicinamibacterales bacterium]